MSCDWSTAGHVTTPLLPGLGHGGPGHGRLGGQALLHPGDRDARVTVLRKGEQLRNILKSVSTPSLCLEPGSVRGPYRLPVLGGAGPRHGGGRQGPAHTRAQAHVRQPGAASCRYVDM